MIDKQAQQIIETLQNENELSITLQGMEESTRIAYCIPSDLPLGRLAFWAAVMMHGQKLLMQIWHRHCIELGVSPDDFNEAVQRYLKKFAELENAETPEPTGEEDVRGDSEYREDEPPEAKSDRNF
jgi:hypothetical protein